jgi:hypothetical protein
MTCFKFLYKEHLCISLWCVPLAPPLSCTCSQLACQYLAEEHKSWSSSSCFLLQSSYHSLHVLSTRFIEHPVLVQPQSACLSVRLSLYLPHKLYSTQFTVCSLTYFSLHNTATFRLPQSFMTPICCCYFHFFPCLASSCQQNGNDRGINEANTSRNVVL